MLPRPSRAGSGPRGATRGPADPDRPRPTGPARPAAETFGLNGGDTPEQLDLARTVLGRALGARVDVVNDAALVGLAAGRDAVVGMVVGTGAVVVGTRPDGSTVTADGHSWLLGDFGSSAGLVREALRAVLRAHDAGTVAGDPLLPALLEAFGAAGAEHLAVVATGVVGPSGWGDHAPRVFGALAAGSPLAAALVAAGVDLPFEVLQAPPVLGALRLAGHAGPVHLDEV